MLQKKKKKKKKLGKMRNWIAVHNNGIVHT